jgi:hypothetical protein
VSSLTPYTNQKYGSTRRRLRHSRISEFAGSSHEGHYRASFTRRIRITEPIFLSISQSRLRTTVCLPVNEKPQPLMAGAKFVVSEAPKLPHSLIQAECSAGVNARHVIIIAPEAHRRLLAALSSEAESEPRFRPTRLFLRVSGCSYCSALETTSTHRGSVSSRELLSPRVGCGLTATVIGNF